MQFDKLIGWTQQKPEDDGFYFIIQKISSAGTKKGSIPCRLAYFDGKMFYSVEPPWEHYQRPFTIRGETWYLPVDLRE